MASVFSIGDSVTFVNEKQNGKVIGFKANNVIVVEIDDGFTIDVLSKEIVIIQKAQEKAMGVIEETIPSKSQDNKVVVIPDFFDKLESNRISILAIPESSAVLSGKIQLMMVNPTDGHFQGALFQKVKNQLHKVTVFSLDERKQEMLFEYTRDLLMSIDSFVLAFTYSNSKTFLSSHKEFTLTYPGLVQNYPNLPAPFCFATVHDVHVLQEASIEIDFDLLKEKFESDKLKMERSIKNNTSKNKKDDSNLLRRYGLSGVNTIVDLHIESLLEFPEGYSNGELLRIQLNHFRSELDKAMVSKMQSIVFIHGVGNGKLKDAIHSELKELHLKYRPADFSKFGIGATEVLIS